MRVVCRADASHLLGAGHVMRLLTLASALRDQGGDALFLTRDHPGHLAELIAARGFELALWPVRCGTILGEDPRADGAATRAAAEAFGADWVLVDHYGTDADWERAQPCPVLALEDLANRAHDCAILLNQNLGARAEDYVGLVTARTRCLMGAEFAMLRPEFVRLRPRALARRDVDSVQNVVISLGGTDQPNATGWVLETLASLPLSEALHLNIVMGPTAPHLAAIRQQAAGMPCKTTFWAGNADLAELMVTADIAIGAAGSTAWERCALGLPTVMVILADNQREIGWALDRRGAAATLELGQDNTLRQALHRMLSDAQFRQQMSQVAAEIADGHGTQKVLDAILAIEVR